MSIPNELRNRVLELDRQDREDLLLDLVISLEPEDGLLTPEEWNAVWAVEIAKRLQDLDEGRTKLIPWEEVRDRLRGLKSPAVLS